MRIPLFLDGEADGLPWRPTRTPGVAWLPLHLEEDSPGSGARRGGATVLIRMDPGVGYEPHRHVGTEDVLVLQGGYRDARGTYRAGEHVHYEAGSVHAPRALGDPDRPPGASNPACVLYATVPEGIELVGPAAEAGPASEAGEGKEGAYTPGADPAP